MRRQAIILVALALPSAGAPAFAQRARPTLPPNDPRPARIVLERDEVEWCFDEVHGRVDLTATVRQRTGLSVSLDARPDDAVELPERVVARPWASFTIRGLHPLEEPPRMNPPAIRVDVTAEANGGTAKSTLTILAGPRAREACREKIRRARETEDASGARGEIEESRIRPSLFEPSH